MADTTIDRTDVTPLFLHWDTSLIAKVCDLEFRKDVPEDGLYAKVFRLGDKKNPIQSGIVVAKPLFSLHGEPKYNHLIYACGQKPVYIHSATSEEDFKKGNFAYESLQEGEVLHLPKGRYYFVDLQHTSVVITNFLGQEDERVIPIW